nr:DUF6783 domain-containing protein [Hungatella effluvii]
MYVTFCGRFVPDERGVVGYVKRIRGKSPAKWGVQMAGMNFQTRPNIYFGNAIQAVSLFKYIPTPFLFVFMQITGQRTVGGSGGGFLINTIQRREISAYCG